MTKNTLLGKKIVTSYKNNNFELKMLKFAWKSRYFFQVFELGNIFENCDQKVPKNDFLAKNHDFWLFLVKIFKNIA